jgi:multisubunit Na+/H+ antiporter MnhF subunit
VDRTEGQQLMRSTFEGAADKPREGLRSSGVVHVVKGRLIPSIKPSAAWLVGLIVVGTLIRIPQLWHGLTEMYAFRQTQTTFVALEYARRGINLLHTPLPIFGPNSDVPMEFPLVQAIAAVLIRLGVGPDSAMRIVGLAGFQAAGILLCVLVLRWHGRFAAIVVLALFEFSPFGLAWGAAALIDFPAVALSLGMVVGLDGWFRTGSRISLLLGAMSGWLAFLVKATTPPAWCVLVVVSAATAYMTARSWSRIITGFLVGPIPGVAAGLWWARYADAVKSRNPLTQFLTSASLKDWNFGTLNQRLHPGGWVPFFVRVGSEIAGPLALGLVLAVLGIILAPTIIERIRRAGWLATAAAAPLLFFNLYRVHIYYLIGIFPAIVAAVGIGIVAVAQRIHANTALVAAAGTALIVVGCAVPQSDMLQWVMSPAPNSGGERIRAATNSSDLILVVGCDWDSTTLYYADRRGLMLRDNNLDVWKYENINDYHYLFACDQALPVAKYVPAGHTVIPTSEPGLWRITGS